MALAPAFREHLLRFEAGFPFGDEVSKLFRAAGARLVWVSEVRAGAPPNSWALHVRLPRHLENHFGVTRQFLVYCLAVEDLRVQEVSRIQSLIRGASDPIEPDLAMIVTADPQARDKIADWAIDRSHGVTVIPVHGAELAELLAGEGLDSALKNVIERWLSARNHYDERAPVTGDRFFGRAALLRDLERRLAQNGGHVGLFGLRRIGKTSLVLELRDRLAKRPNLVSIFVDLESTMGAAHAAYRIGEELARALSNVSSLNPSEAARAMRLPKDWGDTDGRVLISRVADAARALLTDGALRDKHLVVLLDEAEILLPNPEKPVDLAVDLFRAIRGLSQETGRVTLVLAGVNATPTESPLLGSDDNPLFGLLSVEYLGPLEPAECDEMLRKVGRRMQVRWDGPGVSRLTAEVGGHPLLARLAASEVVTTYSQRPLRPTVEEVSQVVKALHVSANPIFEQMINSLQRHYPDELDILQLLAQGEHSFAVELTEASPNALNHLAGYGVVNRDTLAISIPVFERWLQSNVA